MNPYKHLYKAISEIKWSRSQGTMFEAGFGDMGLAIELISDLSFSKYVAVDLKSEFQIPFSVIEEEVLCDTNSKMQAGVYEKYCTYCVETKKIPLDIAKF